jgi:hypothetical protein
MRPEILDDVQLKLMRLTPGACSPYTVALNTAADDDVGALRHVVVHVRFAFSSSGARGGGGGAHDLAAMAGCWLHKIFKRITATQAAGLVVASVWLDSNRICGGCVQFNRCLMLNTCNTMDC